ncbi:MAG TPA: hypothetical protein VGE49_10465, partial [Brevundimonas sp.]
MTTAGPEREGVLPSASRRALLVGGGAAAAAATAAAAASRPAEAAVQVGDESTLSPWGAHPKGPPEPLPRGIDLPA